MFTALILGESHTGKTRSLSTLPGRTILFNFDMPDNVTSLRVPYKEVARLRDFWTSGEVMPGFIVVQYTTIAREIGLGASPDPTSAKIRAFIEDLNSLAAHLPQVDNLVVETLQPFAEEALDFIVASNGRRSAEIQDYKVARAKLQSMFFTMMGTGKNVILTGHLQSEKDEITGRGKVNPMVWGKDLPGSIPKMFGEVFQSVALVNPKGVEYKWMTKPDGFLNFLGSRKLDNLPRYIDQDYGYLVATT